MDLGRRYGEAVGDLTVAQELLRKLASAPRNASARLIWGPQRQEATEITVPRAW